MQVVSVMYFKGAFRTALLVAELVGFPTVSWAEVSAPSQLVPQSLQPAATRQSTGIAISGDSALGAPPGAADLSFVVGNIRIEGAFPELSASVEKLSAQLRGKRVTVAEVFELVKSLEAIHARAGYPLVRVVVPPQKLVDQGVLVLTVIDGFIESIDTEAVPKAVRAAVELRTKSLVGHRHIKFAEIERALLIAGDLPGLKLRSVLMPGFAAGATRLVLEGEHHILTSSVGGDDRLAASLGTWQLRGSIASNSTLGLGEQVYGSVGLSTDLIGAVRGAAPLSIYGGGLLIPLGADGLSLNPEYTRSTTRTVQLPGIPASLGTFERYALRLRDPVIRTRSSTLSVNASVEYVTQQIGAPAFSVLLSEDRYAVARIGPDYSTSLPWGTTLQLAANLSEGLGGRSDVQALASGVPLSRQGTSPEFFKINGSAAASQPLPGELRFDLTGLAQLSMGKPMFRSEQFSMDGSNAVSAFAAGTINADQGATLRGELARPFSERFYFTGGTMTPYVFGAIGYGQLFDVTAVEQAKFYAEALGFGVRTSFQPSAGSPCLNIGLEVARQLTDIQGLRQGWRGNVIASMEF
jgi:hemolysin activation/secretion protein